MSQKKIKNKEKKADDLDPAQDEFINKTTGVLDWAYDRRRAIGLLIAVALIGSVSGIAVDRVLQNRAAEASKLLGQGLEAATAPVVPPNPESDGTQVPAKEDENEELTFETRKARATESSKRWNDVIKGAGDNIKNLGELGLAASHFELGEYDKAVKAFESFLAKKGAGAAIFHATAVEGLGYALEASGKLDVARDRFEKLITETDGEAKKVATYHAGRLAQLKGDKEAAKKHFSDVIATYSETETPSRLDVIFVQTRTRLLQLDPDAKVPELPSGGMGAFDGMDPRILQQLMQARSGAGAS